MDSMIATIKSWIQECSANHSACQIRRDPSNRPGRLLYLELGGQACDKVRLECVDGQNHRYCALSYCWGEDMHNFGRTEINNLPSRMIGFNAAEMPQTVRDSITLCRHLGVSYIWVDAICIVQDDRLDWERESSKMDQIYQGSTFTLIAASSNNANEGFLRSRFTADAEPQLPSRPTPITYNPFRLIGDPYVFTDPDLASALRTRLSTRAWTLQEDILSIRKLYWTHTGVIWMCPSQVHKEWLDVNSHISDRDPESPAMSQGNYPEYMLQRRVVFLEKDASVRVARQVWNNVLTAYLPRQITRSEDRLVAIGGLVKILQPQIEDRYLAGLWLQTLPEDLLWGVKGSSEALSWRSLTWTWASLPANCTASAWLGYPESHRVRYSCRIQDVLTDPPNASAHTLIRTGWIQLLAKTKRFPAQNLRRYEAGMEAGPAYECSTHYISVDFDFASFFEEDDFLDRAYCLKLLELRGREYCLLVEPVDPTLSASVFRRVGRAEVISRNAPLSTPLLHSPGLLGVDELGLAMDQFPVDTFFTDCPDNVVEIL